MRKDFRELHGMATSLMHAPAPPARHLPPDSNTQSRKCGSTSRPFSPTHGETGVRPIETRLLFLAWQLQPFLFGIRAISGKAMRDCSTKIVDDRFPFPARYCITYASPSHRSTATIRRARSVHF